MFLKTVSPIGETNEGCITFPPWSSYLASLLATSHLRRLQRRLFCLKLSFHLPQNESDAQAMDVDVLLELVEDIDKERSKISKLASKPNEKTGTSLKICDHVTAFLHRCPIINPSVSIRLASKYVDQSANTIETAPLNKRDCPPITSDIVLLLAYASQYETRQFNTALNPRKKNSEVGRRLTSYCTTPNELESMKLFRLELLNAERLLIRCEMDHRTLSICAHTSDKNLRCEQLKQIR